MDYEKFKSIIEGLEKVSEIRGKLNGL